MLAGRYVINAIWLLDYEHAQGGICIHRHYRLNKHRDEIPKWDKEFHLIEADGPGRVVVEAEIDGVTYKVINPQNVFSYEG